MSRFVNRLGLALIFFVASNAWALGLGDIRLQSALNQPLRAEIDLLSATPEELAALTVALASADTFERYGIDRPAYLNGIQFSIVNGGSDGSYVQITSRQPITEPFLTFLVEASWSRGRLLREYTVLLDPPTFAPPQPARQAVTAPQRAEPADTGTIQRPAEPAPAPVTRAPARQPAPVSQPAVESPTPVAETDKEPPPEFVPPSFSQADASDYVVAQSQTLWGIARSVRPDSGLTINQVMLAIYEANPDAFGGNINVLRAGATLRIPSADDMYSIDRRSATAEAQRQHDSWDGSPVSTDTADDAYEPYVAPEPEPEPATEVEDSSSLTLVPPDDEPVGVGVGTDTADAAVSREDEILDRIDAIEAEEIPVEPSLIDIRNDELARLRQELADIRGEVYVPPAEAVADGETVDPFVDVTEEATDDMAADGAMDDAMASDEPAAEEAADAEPVSPPADRVIVREPEPGIVDQILGVLTNVWTLIIAGALVLVGGILFFFMRGRSQDDEASEAWSPLDADDDMAVDLGSSTQTQSIPPPESGEDTIVVVEEAPSAPTTADTIEVEAPSAVEFSSADDVSDEPDMMEDTFSSETAVNLDQSDPIAEADFHMAYGLYDQAADLVNGALQADPDNRELLTKLCEIYFVWGNRDSFVDAAQRVKASVGDGDSADWDKIVIMGQQIAGDSELFAGADVAGATKEVDLTFDSADDAGSGDLDMVFGDEGGDADEDGDLDFLFDGDDGGEASVDENLEITQQTPTMDSTLESTAEMPTMESDMSDDGTAALPAIDEALAGALESEGLDSDATAEIDLDDLGLDLDALDEAAASIEEDEDDEMEITGSHDALADTGINEAISDLEETGKNEQLEESGVDFVLDQTGVNPAVAEVEDTDVGVDFDILAATGKTQVLPEQMKVETINEPISDDMETLLAGDLDDVDGAKEHSGTEVLGDDMETLLAGNLDELDGDDAGKAHTGTEVLGDNDATMLAPSPSDEDFDFAKTEALPPSVMDDDTEATAETPALASTDMDLDLDDLTAALDLSEIGDTVEMPGSDATVEQPRPPIGDSTGEMSAPSFGGDDDLSEARTMTEVGTKLDLARAYVDMGDPGGARSILEEVLDEGDDDQRKQAQDLLDSLPS
ncbi:MAG: FimV/HubP family polar landmark protein [Pseudomonadota bacterium]